MTCSTRKRRNGRRKRGVGEQLRREREERERRRLAELRTTLPEDTLATLRHRAEEALAADGVERTRLGYEVLVKLKVDDLLERDSLRMTVEDERESLDGAARAGRVEMTGSLSDVVRWISTTAKTGCYMQPHPHGWPHAPVAPSGPRRVADRP
jgi:hypothetical protein